MRALYEPGYSTINPSLLANADYIRGLESEMFPELGVEGRTVNASRLERGLNHGGFGPFFYLEQGLWDAELVAKFTPDTSLLSIGSGKAYLERFLKRFTCLDKITLSDIEPPESFSDMPYLNIDMDAVNWNLQNEYDIIWFPNSLPFSRTAREIYRSTVLYAGFTNQRKWDGYVHILDKAARYIKPEGEMRFNYGNLDEEAITSFQNHFRYVYGANSSCRLSENTAIIKIANQRK